MYYYCHDFDHICNKFLKVQSGDLSEVLFQPKDNIVSLLALGNLERRQFLKYQERHHGKLKREGEVESELDLTEILLETTATKCDDQTALERFEARSTFALSEASFSTTESQSAPRPFPPMPKSAEGGAHFQCPYCFSITQVSGKYGWR